MRRAAPGRGVGPGPLAPTPITGFLGESRTVTLSRYSADHAASADLSRTLPSRHGNGGGKTPARVQRSALEAGCAGSPQPLRLVPATAQRQPAPAPGGRGHAPA